jgi:adenosylcobinamide-GDP ribazoletransferase
MKGLRLALAFLTRLPVPAPPTYDPATIGASLAWYPAVGALIGLLLWGASALLASVLPAAPAVSAVLLVMLWVWLTGGLHLDGLADTADAAAAGGDATRRLAVLKDPNAGPAGVTAVVLVLLLKTAVVVSLLKSGHGLAPALLAAPVVGRALVVCAFLTTPYVRAGGLGEALAQHHDRRACLASLGVTMLAILILCGPAASGAILLLAGGLLLYWRHGALRHLGGFTGDLAGALVECGEALTLLACVAALAGR